MPERSWHLLLVIPVLLSLYEAAVSATPQEAAVLAQLKDIWSIGDNKVNRWNESVDACNGPWPGITCGLKDAITVPKKCLISNTSCKVTHLDLSNSSLTGEIPFILGGLSNLLSLDLHGNQLVGEVATQLFYGFPHLCHVDFSYNYFNDTIPKLNRAKIEDSNWEHNCFSEYGGCRLLPNMRPLCECQNMTALLLPKCPSWVRKNPIVLYVLVGVCPFSVILCSFLVVMFCFLRRQRKNPIIRRTCSSKIQSVECRPFTYQELEEATNNFHDNRLLGCGGSGSVYQGRFANGSCMVVKQLVKAADYGDTDFWKEVLTIGAIHHPNVVRLRGYCKESRGLERLLVYDYMPNGSVLDALLSNDVHLLPWSRRYSIALATACGLEYLHEHCSPRIIHKGVKPSNILLDRNFTARVGDFGLAKIGCSEQTHIGPQVFVDPDYVLTGRLTDKSDVFSFGMFLLVLIKGRQVLETPGKAQLFSRIQVLAKADDPSDFVDPRLRGVFDKTQITLCAQIALLCTRILPDLRPTMGEIRRILDGTANIPLTTSLINSPGSSSRGSFASECPTPSIGSCYGHRAGSFISDCYMSSSICHGGSDSV
ncbi:protein NSP-INTERACTING KINASE 3 isoform X3 [Physcomitrium patens]|nr:probable LRR receptor-like serine/threonine-protein kinase At5g45780 isoform X3 [Physcomitrium patens]|eukprot:XP_024376273.1 probable LRR receptor-like serine/threonine-protein kinase At5g45780 isoform X3 [Physcomitrella patens]